MNYVVHCLERNTGADVIAIYIGTLFEELRSFLIITLYVNFLAWDQNDFKTEEMEFNLLKPFSL